MDHVIDSESCAECGHDHLPSDTTNAYYTSRLEECCEPGCDCRSYEEPSVAHPRVYKCSACKRMVTRVWRSNRESGQQCEDCHQTLVRDLYD